MADKVQLTIDFPSRIATMLSGDEIDLGLVPVAIIPQLKEYYIISDYCISCDGAVASVCLFSEVPLEKVERILLDYQSKTSVELLKILARDFWKVTPEFENGTGEYQSRIQGSTAALLIGDRALIQRHRSKYIFDLGLEWKKFTGLPFVFAAWISNKPLAADFVSEFNQANAWGLARVDSVISRYDTNYVNLKEYYGNFIKFTMTPEKQLALESFLRIIQR